MKACVEHESWQAPDAAAEGMLRASTDPMVWVDRALRILGLSEAAARLLGIDAAAQRGRPVGAVLRFVALGLLRRDGGAIADALVDPLRQAVEDGWQGEDLDDLCVLVGGSARPVRARFAAVFASDGVVTGAVCTLSERSEAAETPSALELLREQDAVTGLPNRACFERELARCGADAATSQRPYWVAYADLDRFRLVNDACGHEAGDALLRAVAAALQHELRAGDLVARIGGDEFGLLITACSRAEAEEVLRRLSRVAAALHFRWLGRDLPSTMTMGVAPLSSSSESIASVMRMAERARFAAKEIGRGQLCFADQVLGLGRHEAEIAAVSRVLAAIDRRRFLLHSQDVCPARGQGGPVYRELLVRMRDGDGRLVPPSDFIPGAERYFLMDTIDRWVVDAALDGIAAVEDDGVVHAINLSGQSLSNPSFRDWLVSRLDALPTVRRRVCFEITETAAMQHLQVVRIFFEQLSRMGVQLALDDFGVGMSSFGYLASLPVRFLKIDGCFVRDIGDNPFNTEVVRAIADVARAGGMTCIAEHVEDRALLPQLAQLGVHLAQGWGIAREVDFPQSAAARRPLQLHVLSRAS